MFWPKDGRMAYNLTNLPSLSIIIPNFFHIALNMTWTTPSLNCRYPSVCVCTSHRPYGYSPFTLRSWQHAHENSWCNSWHLCCHHTKCWLSRETRTTTCTSFNHVQFFSLTNRHCAHKHGIHTLVNIVIVDPTRAILFPQSYATQGFIASNVAQAKERSYHNQHPTDQFLPLAIEIFGCLHKQIDVFLHDCVNAICSLKKSKSLPLFVLVTFLQLKISITLLLFFIEILNHIITFLWLKISITLQRM